MAFCVSTKGTAGALPACYGRRRTVSVPALPAFCPSGSRAVPGRGGFKPASRQFGRRAGNHSKTPIRPNASKDGPGAADPKDDLEVKVDAVRVVHGSHVVYLKIVGTELLLPVHIGEAESAAVTRELTKLKQSRPLTHDFAKSLLQAIGFCVTRIRITELVSTTYYSRVHIGRSERGQLQFVADVDARPSDAINLALRFGAPMYISKQVAEHAAALPSETPSGQSESPADVVRSVRATLSSFEDPTVMYQLQKSLAIQHQRYEDAHMFQQRIYHEMTHNQLLRTVVAMETALADNRYEEAARLRDEYKQMLAMAGSSNKEAAI